MEDFWNGLIVIVTIFIGLVLGAVIVTVTVFELLLVKQHLFGPTPDLNTRSVEVCKKAGGTPVLENYGNAYKSCAINGKSNTSNVVKP